MRLLRRQIYRIILDALARIPHDNGVFTTRVRCLTIWQHGLAQQYFEHRRHGQDVHNRVATENN